MPERWASGAQTIFASARRNARPLLQVGDGRDRRQPRHQHQSPVADGHLRGSNPADPGRPRRRNATTRVAVGSRRLPWITTRSVPPGARRTSNCRGEGMPEAIDAARERAATPDEGWARLAEKGARLLETTGHARVCPVGVCPMTTDAPEAPAPRGAEAMLRMRLGVAPRDDAAAPSRRPPARARPIHDRRGPAVSRWAPRRGPQVGRPAAATQCDALGSACVD